MRVRVDLLPKGQYNDLVILVDVLRATTSISILLARGAREVWVSPSLRAIRACAQEGDLLLGEREGIPPEGFHYGTSPAELVKLEVEGRRIYYSSDNLPWALEQITGYKHLLLGAFRNARAVLEAAHALAKEEIALVGAGFERAEGLDDTLVAGFLAKKLIRTYGEDRVQLADAARMSIALLKAFPDPQEALWQSGAGQFLARLGYTEDLAYASLISQDPVVPLLSERIEHEGRPLYRFTPWSGSNS
ncbi:2-phosphosulfolactate phosphatase [Marinithermus hydrothermalis]|uniref:Probable 2-phosphosulfolactate phosphatase n=1 Tax=Marinithermus hydrothermalis (strain DSM 14884 / JCM 11576 / T1) TaxID=869210 RepID=F2NL87_MARHT|nr:2-phosphosulfolactate phosphatase [Marinithermus hydrothermalis]AEB11706.1 2-phosphosulfolactate phosphatase [Marinithermus hydrothermalis DSM 14884]